MEYLRKKIEIFLVMSIFAFMMLYLIEFNKVIKIEISCGSFYQLNQMKMNIRVKKQRHRMTRSKIIRVPLTNIHPSILFRERGKNQLTIGSTTGFMEALLGHNIWKVILLHNCPVFGVGLQSST